MPLETSVTNIADLNPAWPAPADPKSDGDDHIRNLKAALLHDLAGFPGAIMCSGTDGGAANAYTVTPTNAIVAYSSRMTAVFSPTVANTGASTINISGLGVMPLRSVNGAELVLGDLIVGSIYGAYYTGTEFRLLSVTKNYIDQLAFRSALPQQASNAGKALFTDGTSAFWAISSLVLRSTRTANAMLAQADRGTLIDIASGTFAQAFDTAANLGAGWYCYMRNSGSGQITIPASDGVSNWIMYPGEARLFQCDGASFNSLVLQPFCWVTQVSGTFVKPPGYSLIHLRMAGGGSGGGGGGGGASGAGTSTGNAGSGGAGGAGGTSSSPIQSWIAVASIPATTPFLVGAGGVGGTAGAGGAGAIAGGALLSGTSGGTGAAGSASTFGASSSVPYYLSSAGGDAGGLGGTAGAATAASGSSNSSGTGTFSGALPGGLIYPKLRGGASANSGQSVGSTPGAGSAGGIGTPSFASANTIAGTSGGLANSVVGTTGGDAATPVQAPPGAGGAGAGGGAGSASPTSGNAATGRGGNGGAGGKGGDGIFEFSGVA